MRALAAALALAAAACSETTPRTEVMIFVRAEDGVRADSDRLEVVVRGGPAGGALVESRRLAYMGSGAATGEILPLAWPVRIALVPEGDDPTRTFAVEARATMASALVAEARVVSGYLAGETLALDVWLRDACIGVACASSETCTAGTCSAITPIDPCALERLEGMGRSEACVSRDSGLGIDAPGLDAGRTDGGRGDAGRGDGGSRDGGPRDGGSRDGGTPDGGSLTEIHNVVFATSIAIAPGDLGGIGGADATCQMLAETEGLPRPTSYVALLSTSSEDARTRIATSRGWVRVDGLPFADTADDLARGEIYYPVALAENGMSPAVLTVATGSDASLARGGSTCADWTNTGVLGTVNAGDVRDGPVRWLTLPTGGACSEPRAIYCFGTGLDRPLDAPPPPPAGARLAFLSTGNRNGRMGIAAFDAVCQADAGTAGWVGVFRALVAPMSTRTAISRFVDGEPWYRPDGVLVAERLAEISTEQLTAPIAVDAIGAYAHAEVWVGAPVPGSTASSTTCADWAALGLMGDTGISSSTWNFFQDNSQGCGMSFRVLCLQQ